MTIPFTLDRIGNQYRCVITDANGNSVASDYGEMRLADNNWTFTYDANGMRTSRTNGVTTYSYVYNGGKLSKMSVPYHTMEFTYDANGNPFSLFYNNKTYYYITNLQGDVVSIVNVSGTKVVNYTYDAWGKVLTITGPLALSIGHLNPLRYRGYIYDPETRLYYLQSRYYDPEMGRFLNADSVDYLGTGSNLTSYNLFIYCGNNPVMGYDPAGHWDWGWEDQVTFGTGVLIIGLALLLAAPTGGASLTAGALAISSSAAVAAGTAAAIMGTVIVGEALSQTTVTYAKQSKKSGKEKSSDKPSWLSQKDVDLGKSSHQNATELLNDKYGSGNWSKGPKTEYNQIVKWIDRGLKTVVLLVTDMFLEDTK